jgi:hypothetical protein
MKAFKPYSILFLALLLSCSSQQNISNLSFADVSLNYSGDEFEIVDLQPITKTASSFMGITSNDASSAILDRSEFNAGSSVSFGTTTMVTGGLAMMITGIASLPYADAGGQLIVGLGLTSLWGAYNDILWANSIRNKAIQRCNYSLQSNYPMYDTYINPKYEINFKKGFFGTSCEVTLYAQGVRLLNKK